MPDILGEGHSNESKAIAQDKVKLGFDVATLTLEIGQIVPLKIISPAAKSSRKFRQIIASIREIGVIEAPVVAKDPNSKERYILLDGHLRIQALKEIGETHVVCLLSTDDESFTYNRHISRLSSIQEHLMIARSIERGVSEDKIALALDLNVRSIIMKKNLLEGICPEAVELLKDKMVANPVFSILRKMLPIRQIEVATLMNDSCIYTGAYAKALLAATSVSQLVDPQKSKKIRGLTEDQMQRMEDEMSNLQREYRLIEENYGLDVLNLTLAKGYLASLLVNVRVVRYLAQNHAEILSEFQKISEMMSLREKDAVT